MARLRIESAPEVTIFDEAFIVKAASGATAPLFQFKDSSGTVVGDITTAGIFNVVSVIASNAGTGATALATRGYVDEIAAGINWGQAVDMATVAALPSSTYANGSAGVGSTLTGSSNGRLTVDGVAITTGKDLLVKDQVDGIQNGIYTITNQGSSSVPFVLTRRSDANNSISGQINSGDALYTIFGSTNNGQGFILTSSGSGTSGATVLGTDSLVYSQFTGTPAILAGAGLIKTRKFTRYCNS